MASPKSNIRAENGGEEEKRFRIKRNTFKTCTMCVRRKIQAKKNEHRTWGWLMHTRLKWVLSEEKKSEREREREKRKRRNVYSFTLWLCFFFFLNKCSTLYKKEIDKMFFFFVFFERNEKEKRFIEHWDCLPMLMWENHWVVCAFPMHSRWHNHEGVHFYDGSLVCPFALYDLPENWNKTYFTHRHKFVPLPL